MIPTTISIHPQGRIILHYRDAVKPLSALPEEERLAVLREMANRYNEHEAPALRAEATPEEALS